MKKRSGASACMILGAAVLACTMNSLGQSGGTSNPAEPLRRLQSLQPEKARTRILVLATFHLRTIDKRFRPGMLDGLVAALEKFKPDAICIESLPGPRVHELELRRDAGPLYGEILDGFAKEHLDLGKPALDLLKSTPPAAVNKVRELLAAIREMKPSERTPEVRTELALWMLAAYDPHSAVLQWSYLSDKEKHAQNSMPAGLAGRLDADQAKINEVPALAVRLARRLGLENLQPVDDFEDLDAYPEILPKLEKDFAENPLIGSVSKARIYFETDRRLEECLRGRNLSPQFRFLNSAEYGEADVDAQWGVFLRTRFPSGSDRGRLALWENRNLKIAARIKAVAATNPGGRILVIFGAAHKPFLEAYLAQTADVEIVPYDKLLER
jgi:hypothetical protein